VLCVRCQVVVAEGVSSVEAVGPRDVSLTPQLSTDTGLGPGGGGSRSDTGTIVHVASSEAAVALNLEDERVSGWVKKSRRKYVHTRRPLAAGGSLTKTTAQRHACPSEYPPPPGADV
jgi:hypothetical protein